jgi:malate synthase
MKNSYYFTISSDYQVIKMTNTALKLESGLTINSDFRSFVETEILPLTSFEPEKFWADVHSIVEEFSPANAALLETRESFQSQIDGWHKENGYSAEQADDYKQFLTDIGYIVKQGPSFTINTKNVDDEITKIAGPQLVVPVKNARFALNAVNARWGSLYDAIYGSDIVPRSGKLKPNGKYNPIRGQEVIKLSRDFLDQTVPLKQGSHHDVTLYQVYYQSVAAVLKDGTYVGLENPDQFKAYGGSKNEPEELVFEHNDLLIELTFSATGDMGKLDVANIDNIFLESAVTTIMDCEDSVAAVDSEDKIEVYRNWLGLMTGKLTETFMKGDKKIVRQMKRDCDYRTPDGETYHLRRRTLMFARNVGHLMTIDTIQDSAGNPIPEGILDGIFTSLIASVDLSKPESSTDANTKTGSIYIVKPKMHGPEEVQFTCDLFSKIENMLGLEQNTIKLGIMDEERRTTVNLSECIRVARSRCVFINTGFLDRTGDEIHTSMQAGPFMRKEDIKAQPWISAYENWNVDVGLACGFQGKAQIGKGMWAMPEEMKQMMEQKIAHPLAGANTAWVPSPTAATLHAMHYHQVNVFEQQEKLKDRKLASLDDILTIPLLTEELTQEQIEAELANNIQGLLGYVVRWVEQGIGCSKVPDINNVGLMEDRATLRISSQHVCNWLHHGICTEKQVLDEMERMAAIVDKQNEGDDSYVSMSPDTANSLAFQAA